MNDTNSLIFDSLFDTLPSGMILFESSGAIVRINQKAKEILGIHPDFMPVSLNDFLRESLFAFLRPLVDLLQRSEADVHRSELSLQLPGREEESVIGFSLKLIASPEGPVVKAFTFSDITQVMKDRLAMDKIKDELSQSKKLAAMGTMIAGVAHEMNNPLTGISMSASLLKMNLERLKKLPIMQTESKLDESLEKAMQEVHKIARASEKAGVLVNDLLSYSKPTQIFLVPMPLHDLVMDTVSALKTHPHFVQFTIQIPEASDRIVLCDRVKLEQVFYNLIKNACDATEGKGVLTITYNEIQDAATGKLLVVAQVRDNGPGIDKSDILHIFDPFFTTKGHGGVGLGLSICYRTMEQQGGLLSVESVKGEGTEFKVTLPVYLEGESEQRVSAP
jgi:two-component system NtrC family sensor kinase